ncbi:ABC transporter ATP-binding protein [Primorskyibacter sp. S187A]|uniref:ABC transporter ATP-binding protein n=1 Tax=Primorskyibacter sp. S187A TaxID=3415130 RepID=UPI003C7C2ED5
MSLLAFEQFSLSIGGAPILRDISLEIAPGEIVALTGESGSGKSMTALCVMQLLPQGAEQTGICTIQGVNRTNAPEAEMRKLRGNTVSMIFQEPMTALNPVQSIGAQIMEACLIHTEMSRGEAEVRAREVLDQVELSEIPLGRYPFELSGGQRQRVAIAMALALRPALLIADEPTTALDVTTQAEILKLLKSLVKSEGMGLMMITHDLAVVADMADRIAVMHHGVIVEQGPTGALFAAMQHDYTRALFAASAHRPDLPKPLVGNDILTVSHATRRYPLPRKTLLAPRESFTAVQDVSFTIQSGQRLGLVGESGCGKSTLTRAILGLEPLQEGKITAFGHSVGPGMPGTARAKLQVVFQDPYGSFNPRHRVSRILTEPFHLLPDPPQGCEKAEKIARALTDVGLQASDAERYIHTFSGGQRQRIAIARALINDPELIVFDEAVSALDVRVRAQVLDLIADLSRTRGLAWLFISHDLSVVRGITDEVMVMQAGQIVERGPTEQVLSAPTHPYTRALIAAAPVLPDLEKPRVPA